MNRHTMHALMPLAVLTLLLPGTAGAVLYTFDCVSNNSAANCNIVETQARVDVTQVSGNIQFKFSNVGPGPSTITDIYFDNATGTYLTSFLSSTSSAGVVFGGNGSAVPINPPGNLFTADFSFGATPPPSTNGINNTSDGSEWLALVFAGNYSNVISALNNDGLEVAIKVQAFLDGGSEVAVLVPEPGTMALLGAGLLALGGIGRKRYGNRPSPEEGVAA